LIFTTGVELQDITTYTITVGQPESHHFLNRHLAAVTHYHDVGIAAQHGSEPRLPLCPNFDRVHRKFGSEMAFPKLAVQSKVQAAGADPRRSSFGQFTPNACRDAGTMGKDDGREVWRDVSSLRSFNNPT
jgi:hypothetical protein